MRNELHATVGKLRQLPRVIAPPPPPGMNGNGNGSNGNGNGRVPDGPAALLALCRDLAMQVQVRLVTSGLCTASSCFTLTMEVFWIAHTALWQAHTGCDLGDWQLLSCRHRTS